MKCKKLCIASSVFALMGMSGMANATGLSDSAIINFTGVFQNSTCNINVNNKNVTNKGSVDVYLGIHTTNQIKAEADATEAVPLNVNFSDCGSILEASIVFSGTQSASNLFDVTGNNKGKVGVGINKTSEAGSYIATGDKTAVAIKNGVGATNFFARYVKIGSDAVVEGDTKAVATMEITYS